MSAAVWLVAASGAALSQQACDTARHALSSPSSRFQDQGDGTVTDKESHLMWMQCSIGQQWSAGHCSGEAALYDWPAAARVAERINRDGEQFYSDWRLPQLRELATIAERQCRNPRINLAVFPDTPARPYWSATSRPLAGAAASAFALDFGDEGVQAMVKAETGHLRLVRNAR